MWLGSRLLGSGYSGSGAGKNDPALDFIPNVGPIPIGKWLLVGLEERGDLHPPVIRLAPAPGTETFHRGGFLIHGDSIAHPGEASHGCIILPHEVREAIWNSGIRELEVIP
jgi:hypothetical protein